MKCPGKSLLLLLVLLPPLTAVLWTGVSNVPSLLARMLWRVTTPTSVPPASEFYEVRLHNGLDAPVMILVTTLNDRRPTAVSEYWERQRYLMGWRTEKTLHLEVGDSATVSLPSQSTSTGAMLVVSAWTPPMPSVFRQWLSLRVLPVDDLKRGRRSAIAEISFKHDDFVPLNVVDRHEGEEYLRERTKHLLEKTVQHLDESTE